MARRCPCPSWPMSSPRWRSPTGRSASAPSFPPAGGVAWPRGPPSGPSPRRTNPERSAGTGSSRTPMGWRGGHPIRRRNRGAWRAASRCSATRAAPPASRQGSTRAAPGSSISERYWANAASEMISMTLAVTFALVLGGARGPVQRGTLHHGGQGELQVFAGKLRQGVLVRDDFALLRELDCAFEHAVGLGHDGVVGRVRHHGPLSRRGRGKADVARRASRRRPAACAGSCGFPTGSSSRRIPYWSRNIPSMTLLDIAAQPDQCPVGRIGEQQVHDFGGGTQLLNGFQQRARSRSSRRALLRRGRSSPASRASTAAAKTSSAPRVMEMM